MFKSLIVIILLIISFEFCSQKKSDNILGDDIRLFKNVAWNLAKSVEVEDTAKIKRIIKKGKVNVDIREPKFGMSLLIWAVSQKKYYSAKVLLEMGADPNLKDYYEGMSAITAASFIEDTSEYLKLVLQYGGNPNNYVDTTKNVFLHSPLIAASEKSLSNVKILLDAGADVNYSIGTYTNALQVATLAHNVDIVWYLLSVGKADFSIPIMEDALTNKRIFITDLMRNWLFDLDSPEYKIKMEIVEFLKKRGMDYRSTEIPERYRNKYTQEYLEKY